MGRYVPPDQEGIVSSGNSLHKRRPPGIRADGSQVVRFEMPFAVWCSSCPKPTLIPQGVRFNATKTKVGSYFSTPIWRFGIKHADCGGNIEVETDPKNTDYRVVSGGKKKDTGLGDGTGQHIFGLKAEAEREKERQSAFSMLEKTIEDREVMIQRSKRIEELEEHKERDWKDPYAANQALRKHFRVGRHEREQKERNDGELRDRLGGISDSLEILTETEEDRRRAALVDFGVGKQRTPGMERPMFQASAPLGRRKDNTKCNKVGAILRCKMTKAEILAMNTREGLRDKVMASARKEKDPFLPGNSVTTTNKIPTLPRMKRKWDNSSTMDGNASEKLEPVKERRIRQTSEGTQREPFDQGKQGSAPTVLVDYDSD